MEVLGALVTLPALTAGLVRDLPPGRCLWCMTSSCDKACYNLVMRLKNSYDDLERQRASLQEQLAKPGVFFGLKLTGVAPSPKSRIPTPRKSPAPKRTSVNCPFSARVLLTCTERSVQMTQLLRRPHTQSVRCPMWLCFWRSIRYGPSPLLPASCVITCHCCAVVSSLTTAAQSYLHSPLPHSRIFTHHCHAVMSSLITAAQSCLHLPLPMVHWDTPVSA